MNASNHVAYAALITRLSLGAMYLSHGLLKLLVFSPAGTAQFFQSLGLPGVLGYLTILAEVGGGLLLLAGVGTRIVSAALIPALLGALFLVHADKGWLFSAPGGGWEYPAFLIATSLVAILLGNGAYALADRIPALRTQRLAS
ncbi:DoxX family protein [Oceanibaculum pacificum]|uniref:LysR family transcriptional regulator n=1 Tax=Oceanibaculum pacificum TaxID=580166 RepID=A0A154WGP0_9PROT|nr:DoxX family protein [Oceanibaculum pacificum]KZD12677.1 LysR family transcriptional regulator [Oceanibaculum pacificum]